MHRINYEYEAIVLTFHQKVNSIIIHVVLTHSRELEMFCSMSPSLSGRILTEKHPLWSMLPMAVTLSLSPSPTSSEQSVIRQAVAWWSVAIGGTNPQEVFPGMAGNGGGGGGGGLHSSTWLVATACSCSRC